MGGGGDYLSLLNCHDAILSDRETASFVILEGAHLVNNQEG